MANAQSETGLAKKIDRKGKIVKLNNHRNTKAAIFSEDFSDGTLPAGWQNVDNGTTGFVWYFDNPGGRTLNSTTGTNGFAVFDSDENGGGAEDCDLITPVIDCSALTVVKLAFEHYYSSYDNDQGQLSVSGDNGTNWTIIQTWTTDGTNATAELFDISAVAAGQSQVMIKWNYQGDYSWYWAIDDVSVFEPEANDLAVTAITPSFVESGATVTPQVTVLNNGTADQATWSVTLTDGTYTSTKTGSNLLAGASVVVDMDSWTPADGNYTMTATVTLTGDANAANDVLTQDVNVVLPSYTAGTLYGYNAYSTTLDQHIVSVNKTTGALNDIALATTANFLSCGDYINGIIYGIESGSNDLYIVDGDGSTYNVGTITGVTSITGIAYDAMNDVVYLSDYGTSSTLFTLDMTTLEATSVGVITSNLIIGIAAGNYGEVWGIDITTDHFWSINTTTGAGTNVGALGAAISYAQDIGYDRATEVLYGTLYTDAGGLYTINVTTGAATLVGTFTDEVSMCAVASSRIISTETDILTFGFNALIPAISGTVNAVDHIVTLTVPYGTDVTALVATFTLSPYATTQVSTVDQISGTTANDFSSPVTYTVTAEAANTQDWVVTVNITPASAETDFITFGFNALIPAVSGTVNAVDHTVTLTVPYGTDVTALVATFTLSPYATAQVSTVDQISGTTANDFSSPVTYTVTAEATNTQDWVVTVDITTGINDGTINNFKVYPNPFNNEIKLEGINNHCKVKIYNSIGQVLIDLPLVNQGDRINTHSLKSGVYMISITTDKGVQITQKLIKN